MQARAVGSGAGGTREANEGPRLHGGSRSRSPILGLDWGLVAGSQLSGGDGRRFRGFHPEAGQIQLQDHAVVHQAVDRRRGGHGILEDPLPLREHQVRGDQHASMLVAMRQQGKQHLHFLPTLLDVAQIVDQQRIVLVQFLQLALEPELGLGDQQPLNQHGTRAEGDREAAMNQFVGQGTQ